MYVLKTRIQSLDCGIVDAIMYTYVDFSLDLFHEFFASSSITLPNSFHQRLIVSSLSALSETIPDCSWDMISRWYPSRSLQTTLSWLVYILFYSPHVAYVFETRLPSAKSCLKHWTTLRTSWYAIGRFFSGSLFDFGWPASLFISFLWHSLNVL